MLVLPAGTFPASLIPATLFLALPLVMMRMVVGRYWTALFRPVGLRQLGVMVLAAFATMLASAGAALLVGHLSDPVANPVVSSMQSMSPGEFLLRLVPTAPQLLGEEILTIVPFLAILWVTTQRLQIRRQPALAIALLGSTAVFAAAHLPTYDWQVLQCFGIIGTARLVLTVSFIWTRNLWVSAGAHVLNDWTEFALVYGLGHLPIGAA